jgi:predicted XRE-type DNA-binding protein
MTEGRKDAANDAVFDSTGNVFADLNLPHSSEDLLKVEISRAIAATIRRRKLTQVQAAAMIGTDQAKISAILRGKLKDFSVDRLIQFLLSLGRDIDIKFSGVNKDKPGRLKVSQAA